ncbi:MAG: hypothetical protein IPP33_03715 [Flavobacteriales bacterium]|nr:hypothetical protein [Flavobacteriales bacterium]
MASIKASTTRPSPAPPRSQAGWSAHLHNDRFIALNDGSTIRGLQCVMEVQKVGAETARALHDQLRREVCRGGTLLLPKAAANAWN